ncbi:hypothetical protein QR685DRAFT_519305 [Neurospora intermedia]|uniref:Uncharacterized protein n=1 Tax=Neurospora intermedia TaxID=5142 RepID=A0ABR3DFL7_NEUIN
MSRIFVGFLSAQLSPRRDRCLSATTRSYTRPEVAISLGFLYLFFELLPHNQAPTPRNNELSPFQAGRPGIWKWMAWHACL